VPRTQAEPAENDRQHNGDHELEDANHMD
jgi:hypothetical protein